MTMWKIAIVRWTDHQYLHLKKDYEQMCICAYKYALISESFAYLYLSPGLRGAPGYSLEQAHHLPIEMDSLVGE